MPLRSFLRPALPLLAVVAAACSSKDDAGPTAPSGASAFTARFELPAQGAPKLLQVPFPSDLHLAADGTIQVSADDVARLVPKPTGAGYIADALAKTHGFGVYGGAVFELQGGAPDASTLPTGAKTDCQGADAPIYLVDLDAGAPLPCQAGWNDDNVFNDRLETTPVLVVRTARGVVLPEKHRIAVLLTSSITSRSKPLAPSAQLASIRDGQRPDAASKAYGDAIDAAVATVGTDKRRVVSAAVYTTGAVTEELRDAREIARATSVPTLKWGKDDVAPVVPARFTSTTPLPEGWTATLDDLLGTPKKLPSGDHDPDWGDRDGVAHDAIGAIGVASFDAPNLLVAKPGDYADPAHGTFFHDASGKVAIDPSRPTAKIWVTFFVPKAPAPAAGYPVVVYQHGMGGQRGDALTLANGLAKKGWVVASIDAVLQGTRGFDAEARGDDKNDYGRAGAKYTGPDGFTDRSKDGTNYAPTDLFGGLFRLAAMRDQFRQSVIDHTTLLRLLSSGPSLDGLALSGVAPKIDGSKVAYLGESLGGILGSLLAGIEPDHKAYILNVPGGALLPELAANSPNIYALLAGSAALNFGFLQTQLPPWHPMVQMMQHVIDGGDPIAVAGTATKPVAIGGATPAPRNILMTEDLGDELVSNQATEALAKAMGIPVLAPHGPLLADLQVVAGEGATNVPNAGTTAVLLQVYPAQHGFEMISRKGKRVFAKDRPLWGDPEQDPFPRLASPIEFENPYLELSALAFGFLDEAFAGKAPTVTWTKAPEPLE